MVGDDDLEQTQTVASEAQREREEAIDKAREVDEVHERVMDFASATLIRHTSPLTKGLETAGPVGRMLAAGIDSAVFAAFFIPELIKQYREERKGQPHVPWYKIMGRVAKRIETNERVRLGTNLGIITMTVIGIVTGTGPLMLAAITLMGLGVGAWRMQRANVLRKQLNLQLKTTSAVLTTLKRDTDTAKSIIQARIRYNKEGELKLTAEQIDQYIEETGPNEKLSAYSTKLHEFEKLTKERDEAKDKIRDGVVESVVGVGVLTTAVMLTLALPVFAGATALVVPAAIIGATSILAGVAFGFGKYLNKRIGNYREAKNNLNEARKAAVLNPTSQAHDTLNNAKQAFKDARNNLRHASTVTATGATAITAGVTALVALAVPAIAVAAIPLAIVAGVAASAGFVYGVGRFIAKRFNSWNRARKAHKQVIDEFKASRDNPESQVDREQLRTNVINAQNNSLDAAARLQTGIVQAGIGVTAVAAGALFGLSLAVPALAALALPMGIVAGVAAGAGLLWGAAKAIQLGFNKFNAWRQGKKVAQASSPAIDDTLSEGDQLDTGSEFSDESGEQDLEALAAQATESDTESEGFPDDGLPSPVHHGEGDTVSNGPKPVSPAEFKDPVQSDPPQGREPAASVDADKNKDDDVEDDDAESEGMSGP